MKRLEERYQVIRTAASSHAGWSQQWAGYSAGTVGSFLTYSDARRARLQLVVELGQQGRHALSVVVAMTDDKWEQEAARIATEGAASAERPAQVGA
jgi:nicotinamide mononucleotide (NMN) deamidase PncC